MLHVSFICTGNICRSPMAEQIFAAHAHRAGLAVRASSAGTYGGHAGSGADPRTQAVLLKHGYPAGHTAAIVSTAHLAANLLVAMDSGHDAALARLGVPASRRRLLRSFDPGAASIDVADPYVGTIQDFERVRSEIESAIPGLLDWVRNQPPIR